MIQFLREFRSLTPAQKRAFAAAFFGWMLDGFDFTILTFVLADIQRSFTVDNALAGALGTVTLMFRLIGGAAAGTAADRWGRKLPLMLSIVWFSLFTVLSGFSTSYAVLFACRALFGIGMGGEWAAGMPLALEHLPDRLQGRCGRHSSGCVGVGIHPVSDRVSDAVSGAARRDGRGLARDVLDRRDSRAARAVDSIEGD